MPPKWARGTFPPCVLPVIAVSFPFGNGLTLPSVAYRRIGLLMIVVGFLSVVRGGLSMLFARRVRSMNKQPSFARCRLHLACIVRNPSRFAFYAHGIIREFKQASGFALCVALAFFCFGISLVNFFFQH